MLVFAGMSSGMSCSKRRYINTDSGGIRPAKSHAFKYARRIPHWHPILDTTVLYVRAFDSPEVFQCYRFFGDGRALYYVFTSTYGGLDTANIRNPESGHPCYYYIRNSREIWIQRLATRPTLIKGWGAYFDYTYGLLDTVGIELLVPNRSHHVHERLKAKRPNDPRFARYEKTAIPVRYFPPNW